MMSKADEMECMVIVNRECTKVTDYLKTRPALQGP